MTSINPYQAPQSTALDATMDGNTSGMGKGHPLPEGVAGWSWGAFMWNWLWSCFNSTWIGLIALVPYVGFVMAIILGVKGREWAWRNKQWDSVEHFNRVQRRWSIAALIPLVIALIGIVAAIMIPMYAHHH